jgi:hypothetical protein
MGIRNPSFGAVSLNVLRARPWGMGSFQALLFRAWKLPIPQDIRADQIHTAEVPGPLMLSRTRP